MKNAKVTLVPLEAEDREQFILDNQESFKYGAAAGFVFHFLYGFDDDLAVFLILNDFCVEQYGFLFPIHP